MISYLLIPFIFVFVLVGCGEDTLSSSDCNDCNDSLNDDYLYKEIMVSDLVEFQSIDDSINVGNCIRYKLIEEDYSSVAVVNNCCCIIN